MISWLHYLFTLVHNWNEQFFHHSYNIILTIFEPAQHPPIPPPHTVSFYLLECITFSIIRYYVTVLTCFNVISRDIAISASVYLLSSRSMMYAYHNRTNGHMKIHKQKEGSFDIENTINAAYQLLIFMI